jgi:hypothetical protein
MDSQTFVELRCTRKLLCYEEAQSGFGVGFLAALQSAYCLEYGFSLPQSGTFASCDE